MIGLYTCARCKGTFESDWSQEEAQAEAETLFTAEELRETAVICDDCWLEFRAWQDAHPEATDLDADYSGEREAR